MNTLKRLSRLTFALLMLALAACSGGTVQFAPTAPPPDLSPIVYQHPSGAFSVSVPPNWSVYVRNTTTLATAGFSAPGDNQPSLVISVVNLGSDLSADSFSDVLNRYQTQVRPDLDRYVEQSRQAMGDGSWRITGVRSEGLPLALNTFIQRSGSLLGIADVTVPGDAARMALLQSIVNTFTIHPDAKLDQAPLSTLAYASGSDFGLLHVKTWTTADGVFYITGEVANYGDTLATDLPVQAQLLTADGLNVSGAQDTVMGYGIPPGGFAPFSLRFGQQPALSTGYTLSVGSDDWRNDPTRHIYSDGSLEWTDDSSLSAGQLTVTGTVKNTGAEVVRKLRAVVTVFDAQQAVVAARFTDLNPGILQPGESAPFGLLIPELAGSPANFIVNLQGLP
jgi:hypothetical protein